MVYYAEDEAPSILHCGTPAPTDEKGKITESFWKITLQIKEVYKRKALFNFELLIIQNAEHNWSAGLHLKKKLPP